MAYISLEELKEILPDIFNAWVNDNDEGWEWIFQEIEQKCHVGKRKKNKKRKKHKKDDVSTLKNDISVLSDRSRELNKKVDEVIPKIMGDFDARINAQTKRVDELSNKISNQSASHVALTSRVSRVERDIIAAKSMAKVDYSKYSGKSDGNINYNKEKSDANVIQEVYNRMAGRGATREELDTFRNLIQKYDALEKKEIPVVEKMCATCRYSSNMDGSPKSFNEPPCHECNNNCNWKAKDIPVKEKCVTCKYFEDKITKFNASPCNLCNGNNKWEAKDNG